MLYYWNLIFLLLKFFILLLLILLLLNLIIYIYCNRIYRIIGFTKILKQKIRKVNEATTIQYNLIKIFD